MASIQRVNRRQIISEKEFRVKTYTRKLLKR